MRTDPLDSAVDRAHAALGDVVRIAEQRDAWKLARFAEQARRDLLDTWEDSE